MNKEISLNELNKLYPNKTPKIIGGFKSAGWAKRILNKISNPDMEVEFENVLFVKSIIKIKNGSFYPAFLSVDMNKNGLIVAAYLIAEQEEQFDLIPLELAIEYIGISKADFFPLRYKTVVKLENDQYQKNWPDFS